MNRKISHFILILLIGTGSMLGQAFSFGLDNSAVMGANNKDSIPNDTLIKIALIPDSIVKMVESNAPAEPAKAECPEESEIVLEEEIKETPVAESEEAELKDTIAAKPLEIPIPPGIFKDSEFTFVLDDAALTIIDQLVEELYTAHACIDTLTKQHNPYDFCPDQEPIYTATEYEKRIDYLNQQTPFPLSYNKVVHKFIELYALRRRDQVSRMLGLSELYFPMFTELLSQYDLPLELKYLAIVESALRPNAGSRAGAKGLWQFMYRTGKIYGLEVTSYTDERFDPYQSTVAACEYLSFLYGIYDDWGLVLAAYNSGPGRVNRAIRRSGGKRDYWEIWRHLPRETRGYVPAFIAVNYIMEYATEHNIYPTPPPFLNHQSDTVVVRERITFEHIEKVIGVPEEVLAYLNPMYTQNIIPGIVGESYALTLPVNKIGDFINNKQAIVLYKTEQERIDSAEKAITLEKEKTFMQETKLTHTVRYGEVLGLIAQKYNAKISEVKAWNDLSSSRIYVGQKLTIYTGKKPSVVSSKVAASANKKAESKDEKFKYHTIQSGDTLWDIAKLYDGVTITELKKLNQIDNAKKLKPGMKIKIAPISS
ncbi:MAG TPA: LysM peptidoglycan-binding domain-containing protein [Flavobacteriales bacterium]|nr:LysM peptidoglycan-binding domain-containing protein [Flavobacteriales bacterium]